MTQVLALPPRHMEAGPVHSLMDLNAAAEKGNGSRAAMDYGSSHFSPPRTTPTRKRSASLSNPEISSAGYEHAGLGGSDPMKLEAQRDIICLCTPAPKIPRPRNAFILYRQHHQARVTADNPKLSNPEISKIIGEKWKYEVEDVKEYWKKLAEEEKQRHQHQYPNYRYQPRRGARAQGSWSGPSSVDDQGRCPKCNGRFIATPRTPSTPAGTPPSAKTAAAAIPRVTPTLRRIDTGLSPRMSVELSPGSKQSFPGHLPHPLIRNAEDAEPMSPEMKRRRANTAGGYHIVSGNPSDYMPPRPSSELIRMASDGPPPGTTRQYAPLPDLRLLPRSQSGPMPPPPLRASGPGAWSEYKHTRRHSGFDESLRLPPLQTSVSPSSARIAALDTQQNTSPVSSFTASLARSTQDKAAESAIMSWPYKRKLAVLAKICRPAPRPGYASAETRGPFIAVEGPCSRMLREVGQVIENGMLACDEVALKVWGIDSEDNDNRRRDDSAISQSDRGTDTDADESLAQYFQTIVSWQAKSRQLTRHIKTDFSKKTARSLDEEIKGPRPQLYADSATSPTEANLSPTTGPSAKIPVALAKEGFSLTLSDRFACNTPITDTYSPIDHWEWMASLWRGVACPDLVVYVAPSSEEDISQLGAVEFLKNMGLIVVRVANNKSLDEATGRRMAFEVMEWMREGSFREDVPDGWRHE